MKIAYLDCFSGVSGDMMLAALLACGVSPDDLRSDLAGLSLPGWTLDVENVSVSGIDALDVTVQVSGEQPHRHLEDIERILDQSTLTDNVRQRATAVFVRLAQAEGRVHGCAPEHVHFHEVGAVDAIVDIVGCCCLLDRLGVDAIECASLPMGHGFVTCAHGNIPLPAPAVLEITKNVPVHGVDVEGELVTPTGAALVTVLARAFGPMPAMTQHVVGYGAGKSRFPGQPNLLRVVVGEASPDQSSEEVVVLEANLDDFNPQFYDVLSERLFQRGALDVYLTDVQMKKGRPGVLVTVLAPPARGPELVDTMFAETTTLGLRMQTKRRLCMDREWVSVETRYGKVRVKLGRWRGSVLKAAPEYEDVRACAEQAGVPLMAVHQAAMVAYGEKTDSDGPSGCA